VGRHVPVPALERRLNLKGVRSRAVDGG
jgi:hypothetical protein